jgi:tyrosyl-tRNA synthetase
LLGILPGTDGVIRMSKSLGNHIPILAAPEDMYGKVMSLPDNVMPIYFKLVTRYMPDQIKAIESALTKQMRHPRDVKMELAREIVSIFHGDADAAKAEEHFKRVFQEREIPDEMPEYTLQAGQTVVEVIMAVNMAESKSKARSLIDQKGVKLDGQVIERDAPFPHPGVLQVGKRRFLRVK